MSVLLSLEFDGLPPTANNMYRNSGSRRYKRQEVQDWQDDIAGLMSELWKNQPYRNRSQVNINFTTKDKRNWDIDNRIKPLLDCLEIAGVLLNDNQIDGLNVRRRKGDQNKTLITLMEFTQ
ncbi:MAG: RusA family crossover junction endodeoxyribonuclease [Synergistaceae bacterium]|nr:RusA family crossover junction endodeoxyribonuclease [Synergistaceae bacterium]